LRITFTNKNENNKNMLEFKENDIFQPIAYLDRIDKKICNFIYKLVVFKVKFYIKNIYTSKKY